MNRKCPFTRSLPEYLVLYHLNHAVRYEEDELLWRFCSGYLVLYHFLVLPPRLNIVIPSGKVSGVFLDPCILGSIFPFLFTPRIKACLLPLLHSVIRTKVFSTELALFDHRKHPRFLIVYTGSGAAANKSIKNGKITTEGRSGAY